METMKMNDAAKKLFDKRNRINILLGIIGWVSLALGVLLLSFGLWKHFQHASSLLTATYRDSTVYVEASYGKEAQIPSNAELRAHLVTSKNEPDRYAQNLSAAMAAVGQAGETVPESAFYHIGFYVGDQEIEPAAPVNVNVQILHDGLAVGAPIKVVHLKEDGAEVIADTTVDDAGSISFTTDGFSDFIFIFPTGDDQPDDVPSMESNGIVGNGRRWTGIALQDGGFEEPSFDEPTATSEGAIDLNELEDSEVGLTFRYKESGEWKVLPNDPNGENIFDHLNTDISITFNFNKEFSQEELRNADGTLTYQLPPYLTGFSAGQSGKLLDQNGKEAGTVTVDDNGKVTVKLNEDFIEKNSSAKDLHFTLSGQVDLDKAYEGDSGDPKYPGFNLVLPTDKNEAHSQYGTLQLEKTCSSDAPYRDADGNWYLDYKLTVTSPDFDMPEVRVEDVFKLSGSDKLKGLIEGYVLYSVNDEPLSKTVGSASSTEKDSVYQTDKNGVPQLNWYLGDMKKEESRTLHYRVKLNTEKMEETDFTKGGTILPNNAEVFSRYHSRNDAHAQLSLQTYVYVSKYTQNHPETGGVFVPDGEGGGYIEYEVTVRNDRDYPVEVKVYDSLDDPHTNTTGIQNAKGLSYVEESFKFSPEQTKAGDTPWLEFSEAGDKYTSFTAHIGWLDPDEEITFTYRIKVSAEELAAGPVVVNNGIISLFESQDKVNETYPHWMERYQQQNTVEQDSWAAKNYGDAVDPGTMVNIPTDEEVYEYDDTTKTVTKVEESPGSFVLGEHSFMYTVTVNGNTIWDVSSATMGDHLSNGLHYSGYVKVEAKDSEGETLKTVWVKVDELKELYFEGDKIGFEGDQFGAGTSYELTYYTTIDEDYPNVQIVMGNDFSLKGKIEGDGKVINVSVQDSTSNRAETSNHRDVSKNAWYYESDENGLGAFYWVVKVDTNYIPNGYALQDVTGDKHELRGDSLLGVYVGPEYTFDENTDWDDFLNSASTEEFTKFVEGEQYSSELENKRWTVKFTGEYKPSEGQYVYLFFKTYVTDRQPEPYENDVYSNEGNIPDQKFDQLEDKDTNHLPDVASVEKAGMQVFDWNGKTIEFLNNANTTDYKLDASNMTGLKNGRYAAWSVSVNRTGTMQGDYTITDEIPAGMELSFVAIANSQNITFPTTGCTPPWPIPLSEKMGDSEPGLRVGGAHNSENYINPSNRANWEKSGDWKPWNAENWKYYPSEDRSTVSWGLHIEDGLCNANDGTTHQEAAYAYEVDYLVVCRVTDPDVLLGVTQGDPQKKFNNHVYVKDSSNTTVASDDAQVTVPCNPVVTKDGHQVVTEQGEKKQTIKFTLEVNTEEMVVEGLEKLTLKDKMSGNLALVTDSVKFYSDPDFTDELTKDDGVSFTPPLEDNIITFTIPNGQAVYIQYECEINAPENTEVDAENIVYFEGRQPSDDDETWKQTVSYEPGGGISGNKKMQIRKVDSVSGTPLPGAEFEVTLLGVTDENGIFVKSEGETEKQTLTTDADGISESFTPKEGGLYKIVETQAPEGYVPDDTPRYYWIGKGSLDAPTANEAGLDGTPAPEIKEIYNGTIDVVIGNEKAKITVTKKFVNADGNELVDGVTGTYTFGLFTHGEGGYTEVSEEFGGRQSLTYPDDKGEVLTFYVPYQSEPPVQYYILELDEDGKPMEQGSKAWIQTEALGTMEFEPSYEYSPGGADVEESASSGNAETTVTVTNTCYATYRLPESGSPGTLFYLLTGLMLVACSVVMLTVKRRRRAQ